MVSPFAGRRRSIWEASADRVSVIIRKEKWWVSTELSQRSIEKKHFEEGDFFGGQEDEKDDGWKRGGGVGILRVYGGCDDLPDHPFLPDGRDRKSVV